ncbi:hypothetical protein Tco_0863111 [Tanacetum coccineum]
MFQDFRYSDTTHLSRSVKVLKLKNFKKDAPCQAFKKKKGTGSRVNLLLRKGSRVNLLQQMRWDNVCDDGT